MSRVWLAAWLAFCMTCMGALGPRVSWARDIEPESEATARRLGKEGATAYQAANYAEAIDRFDRAFALLPAPAIGLWAARSYAKLGRLVEAAQRYQQVQHASPEVGDPAIQRQAQLEAKQELAELLERIPKLGVKLVGAPGPVLLRLDERPFESEPGQMQPVDPGQHVLVGTHGEQRVSMAVEIAPGERRELVLAFPAAGGATAPEPTITRERARGSARAWRTAGWVGVGAGGAALLTGIVTRAVAQSRYDELRGQGGCSRSQCPPEQRDRVDSYNSMRSISIWTSVGGAVLAAAGAGLLLFGGSEPDAPSVALSPGGLALRGRF